MSPIVFYFPYRKDAAERGTFVYRPKIPVTLISDAASFDTVGLLDSGSDVTLISRSVAEALGIALEGRKAEKAGGLGSEFDVVTVRITFLIKHKTGSNIETKRITTEAEVPVDLHDASLEEEIILGRKGIFEEFDITFQENKRRVMLKASKRK